MKKWTLVPVLTVLAHLSTFAQPIATAANVTDFTGEFYFAEATNFNPGPAGANQTWGFSNLQLILGGLDTPQNVASSPFASQFPTANNCYKFSGIFPPDRYYYQLVTPSKYEILGLAMTATTGENYTPNPRTFAVFPYTFNTVFSDTYRTVNESADTSVVITYDAYGTLVLPTGSYTNVIRQKVVKNGTIVNYNWFNVQPFYPLLQTVLEENSVGVVKAINLGLAQAELAKSFSIYPNPTNGEVNIEAIGAVGNAVEIEVFDLLGKKLTGQTSDKPDQDLVQLNISRFDAGVYLIKITDAVSGAAHVQRIVKK